MYRTPKWAYALAAVLGALAAAVIVLVRDVQLGYVPPVGAGLAVAGEGILTMVLPEVVAAFVLFAFVFSRSNILARTYDGVFFGGIYALFFSIALAVCTYGFGIGNVQSLSVFACEAIVRLACGLLLGAAVGQARYCMYRADKGTGRRFVIAGLLIWLVFQSVYAILKSQSAGGGLSTHSVVYVCVVAAVTFLALRSAVRHRKFDWEIRRV